MKFTVKYRASAGHQSEKWCTCCKSVKPLDSFGTRIIKASGNVTYRSRCNECLRRAARKRYQENPNSDKTHNTMRKYRYGISKDEFDELKRRQQGRCAICSGKMKRFSIDHCHRTGIVRGLLCSKCNSGLGFFDDNVAMLQLAIEYIERTM